MKETNIKLQSQFGREPTLAEWADGVGLSCRALQARLHCGNRSKDKLINANLRLVVHIAKYYQGRGLSLQDLLQVSSKNLEVSDIRFVYWVQLILTKPACKVRGVTLYKLFSMWGLNFFPIHPSCPTLLGLMHG